jgi:hypothetical protein
MKGLCTKLSISLDGGTTWDTIGKLYNLSTPERTREVIEDDDLLDCVGGIAVEDRLKEGGARQFGDLVAEVRSNPSDVALNNTENHHLLVDAFEANTQAYFKVNYTDANASGEVWHGFVSTLGSHAPSPNEQVRRQFTITPTGRYHAAQEAIDSLVIPAL